VEPAGVGGTGKEAPREKNFLANFAQVHKLRNRELGTGGNRCGDSPRFGECKATVRGAEVDTDDVGWLQCRLLDFDFRRSVTLRSWRRSTGGRSIFPRATLVTERSACRGSLGGKIANELHPGGSGDRLV
jgi:hypothetical protein